MVNLFDIGHASNYRSNNKEGEGSDRRELMQGMQRCVIVFRSNWMRAVKDRGGLIRSPRETIS